MNFIARLLFIFLISTASFASENLFYVLRNHMPARFSAAEHASSSLKTHFQKINLLVSQAYQVDENGVVWGFVDPDILDFANKNSVKLMLLITNRDFNKDVAHQFLANQSAQTTALNSILDACQKTHCYGAQFDFEMIALEDREALTRFYQSAAQLLHKKGLVVSFALAPLVSDSLQPSEFLRKLYINWEGAYDFKKLGEAADFVSIMTYNQHGGPTTPGPTASIGWVEEAIRYALQHIPAQKISLGIPTYSTYWFTGTDTGSSVGKIKSVAVGMSYEKMTYLINKYKVKLQWDDGSKINYAMYERHWLNEYVFVEDAKSFAAKLALVQKYNLRGISVFDLGTEDPHIWDVLASSVIK